MAANLMDASAAKGKKNVKPFEIPKIDKTAKNP